MVAFKQHENKIKLHPVRDARYHDNKTRGDWTIICCLMFNVGVRVVCACAWCVRAREVFARAVSHVYLAL